MKKLLLIASLLVVGLSGCVVWPDGGHNEGVRNAQDHGQDRDRRDQGDQGGDHGGDHGGSGGYH